MRYHKAKVVTQPEATFIIRGPTESLNACVVIEHFGTWFDVRKMTDREVDHFVNDLDRTRRAEVSCGLIAPN
jgi:hypothetical protein